MPDCVALRPRVAPRTGPHPALRAWMRISMLIRMRSTIVIEDQLFKLLKRRAADLNTSLSEVVNQALRESLSRPVAKAPPFKMVTFGASEPVVHHEPDSLAAALLDDDTRTLGR